MMDLLSPDLVRASSWLVVLDFTSWPFILFNKGPTHLKREERQQGWRSSLLLV